MENYFSRESRDVRALLRLIVKNGILETMILVKNAKIVDGSGEPMRRGDIFVSGKAISAMGNFPNKKADVTIEALGMLCVPGFVDIHSHMDHSLAILEDPGQDDCLASGVTTAIGGNDGISLAPLMYGSLDPLKKWAGGRSANVGWHGMKEFRRMMESVPLGPNFGTLAGYETIRRDVQGKGKGDLTDREMRVAAHIGKTAMREGALGISLDLKSPYGQKISHEEARAVAQAVAEEKGVLAIGLRRHEEHCMEAVQEALSLYKATGVTMVIAGFVPNGLNKATEREFLLSYEAVKNAGDNLFIEIGLGDVRLAPLADLLPHHMRKETFAELKEIMRDKSGKKELVRELPRHPDAVIARVPWEHKQLAGITIETFARDRDMTAKEALLELMRLTRMNATIAVKEKLSPLALEIMDDDHALIAGPPKAAFAAGDALRWPIEKTVMKLTHLPARAYGLGKRGMLKENWSADMVLMDDRYEIARTIVNGAYGGKGGAMLAKAHSPK